MLAQLLPGLRQVRTPFASGLLLVVLAWLLFADNIRRDEHEALFASIDALGSALKSLGVGFSVTLGAYLIGAAFEALWTPLFRLLPSLSSRGRRSIYRLVTRRVENLPDHETLILAACRSYTATQQIGAHHLLKASSDLLRASSDEERVIVRGGRPDEERRASTGTTLFSAARGAITTDLISGVEEELDVIGTRLLDSNADLFNVYDRLNAEAEFRSAIAVPLGALAVVVGVELLPWPAAVFLAVGLLVLFISQSVAKKMGAGDRIIDALVIEAVHAPSLEDLEVGTYTHEALREGRVRVGSISELPGSQLYRFLGIPWHRKLRLELGTLVPDVRPALFALAEAVTWPMRVTARGMRATARWLAFALRDISRTGTTVTRQRHKILRDGSMSHRDRLTRLGALYREYGYYREALAVYDSMNESGVELCLDTSIEAQEESLAMHHIKTLQEVMDKLVRDDQLDRAERICRKAIRGGETPALILLGDLMQIRGDPEGAEKAYRSAAGKGHGRAWEKLGDMRQDMGDLRGAADAYGAGARMGGSASQKKLERLKGEGDEDTSIPSLSSPGNASEGTSR